MAAPVPESHATRALDDDERTELDAVLAAGGHDLEYADGLFCALICGPAAVDRAGWLTLLFPVPVTEDAAARVLDLVERHWNDIAHRLSLAREALDEDSFYLPFTHVRSGAPGEALTGQRWAEGFRAGMAMAPDAWRPWLADEQVLAQLAPIVSLARPAGDARFGAAADREALTDLLPLSAYRLARQLAARRRAPLRVDRPGRNAACPCGSGRKYKHCCGAGRPVTH